MGLSDRRCAPPSSTEEHVANVIRHISRIKQRFHFLSVSLPSFNRIDVPPYESYEKLYEKLLTAIEETCGFFVE
ncbi:UNVERIFIED_CONTAM: hypothetical protein FKN15_007679 [Acipenser sinensis]